MSESLNSLFSVLADSLASRGLSVSPSEMHGVMCGLLASGVTVSEPEMLGSLAGHLALEQGFTGAEQGALVRLHEITQQAFEAGDYDLALLLPEDDEELALRLAALAQWSEGFLAGFGVASAGVTDSKLSPALQEALSDIAAISQVGSIEEDEEEDAEGMVETLIEHSRVSALMVFTESLHSHRRADSRPAVPPTTH